jgi:two-component system, cell cycle sensor histidine kinase and response regulator CckA
VQSAEKGGTTFTLYFPATRKIMPKQESSHSLEELRGEGQRILVVDDIKEQREIAYSILTELGYSVSTAAGGEEAIDYVKGNRVDLLVLDMIMDPRMDGLETYRRISELNPGQKALIASGFSETDRVKEALSLGAGQYIRKPYTLEKIALAVKKELGG